MGRMEIITRTERRRRYSDADRTRILAEADEPGATVRSVAQKYDIAESLIYGWRSARRLKASADSEPMDFVSYGEVAAVPDPFLPPANMPPSAPVCADRSPLPPENVRPHPGNHPGAIEVSLPSGVHFRVDAYVNEKALARVLRCLEVAT